MTRCRGSVADCIPGPTQSYSGAARHSAAQIPEADAEAAGGAHQGAVGIDLLRPLDRAGERHIDNLPVLPGDHAVEPALGDQIDRTDPKGRADQPVFPVRLAAALDMAEQDD